jgi:hypothetical protein
MPIKMNKPSESSFGINIDDRFDPADDHTVVLNDMDEFQGVSKIDGKPYTSIKWVFGIYDADGVAFTNLIDGGAYETWQFTSLSLAPKSNGRAFAAALLGKTELTDAECDRIADNFDQALVGKSATASWRVEEDKANGNKRLKLILLRPLRRKAAPSRPAVEAAPEFIPREVVTEAARNAAANGARRTAPSAAQETAAERRARLQAELAAMSAEDGAETGDEAPF